MKLFVTGLSGALGRAVAAEAVALGHRVVGIDQSPCPPGTRLPEAAELHIAAVEEPALYARLLHGCDAVIHCAAMHMINGRDRSLCDYLRANFENTARLLELGREAGVSRFVLSSSMTVLIGEDSCANGLGRLDEDHTPRSRGHYSFSKILMEKLAAEYARLHDVSVCCVRPMAFGQGKTLDEIGFGLLGLWVSDRDVARACILAAERDGFRGDCFNIGSASPLTNADIREAQSDPWRVLERLHPGCRAVLEPLGYAPRSSDFYPVACNRKSARVLGYQPLDTFESWLRSKGWGSR